MDDRTQQTEAPQPELKSYTPPEVTDYGSLQALTARHTNHGVTDVPQGSAGPQVFS